MPGRNCWCLQSAGCNCVKRNYGYPTRPHKLRFWPKPQVSELATAAQHPSQGSKPVTPSSPSPLASYEEVAAAGVSAFQRLLYVIMGGALMAMAFSSSAFNAVSPIRRAASRVTRGVRGSRGMAEWATSKVERRLKA